MKFINSFSLLALILGLLTNGGVCAAQEAPKVLLYHSFDGAIEKADYSAGPVEISANKEFKTTVPAISGKAAWFAATDPNASLQIAMKDLFENDSWTISLWEIIDVKDWLSAPHDNLITLLDADKKPIVKLSKSGDIFVYDGGKEIHQDCFDALYWVRRSREHLTLTWDASDSGVKSPAGILRAFWKARPYAALAIDIKRKPVYLEIGMATSGFGVDDLYVFDGAIPLRSVWELMRWEKRKDIKGLEKMLADRGATEAKRGAAARAADWVEKTKAGIVFEAESNPGENKVVVCPVPNPDGEARESAVNNNGATASGRACVEPGSNDLTFKIQVEEAGKYALALRYCFGRKMNAMWPQDSTAKTPWTENYAEVEVRLDGKKKPISKRAERLYPTGSFAGHVGDVEMWAWHALNRGKKVKLSVGEHTVVVSHKGGRAPIYDAMLISKEPGEAPPHPRWVDLYRIPPAWWVESHKTATKRGKRIDTYEVILRNRCDEPCSYEIIAGPDNLEHQTVGVRAAAGDKAASTCSVALKPFEQKSIEVVFETPAKLTGICEWANIYLWNDDVALRQKYMLWNLIPDPNAAAKPHPRLFPAPDPKRQAELRAWLKTRDEKALTPELQKWINGFALPWGGISHGYAIHALKGERLKALDDWMKMSEAEMEQYLPDGPPESNSYGTGWDRVSIPYSGKWYVMPRLTKMEPETDDIDMVRTITYEGDEPKKGAPKPYKRVYTVGQDNDVISCFRNIRFGSMLGGQMMRSAPYKNTALGQSSYTGIGLLVEAYYLTGDPAYAQKAFEMLKVFAWKYTGFTKHFFFTLNREDRNWWGARTDGRYQFKYGSRHYQPVGTKALDLMWDVLTPEQRTIIEHNFIRWGIYETMAGPLWDSPGFFAAVNREDMPFLAMGVVLADPAPEKELDFFFDLFKDVLHPDGLHICSLGSYASVGMYATFMQKMEKSGFHIKDDPALKNLFHAQPSFIFSGGGFPNLGDGGGVNIQGLGAGYGCANKEQYAWGKKLLNGDSTFDDWPKLIHAAGHFGEKKMEGMRKQYLESGLPIDKLWPPVYIAPITGVAMLRNRVSAEPIDWVEVIFDYGKMIGRVHGHAAKLATVPSFNGQIVSMGYGYGAIGEPVGSFHTSGYAHNIVQADRKSQFSAISPVQIGDLRESHSEKAIQWVDADSSRLYKKIYMRRTLFTTDFGIVDLYLCRADKQHEYEWMFHSFGVAGTDVQVKPVAKLADTGVLTFAVNPRSALTKKAVRVTWENAPITKPPKKASTALLHEKAFVRVHVVPSGETGVHLFGIPITENCGSEIDYLMLRRNAASTVFATVQEPWRESTGPKVKSLRALPVKAGKERAADSEAYALEVTRTDGRREVFFVNYTESPKTVGRVTTDAGVAFWKIDKKGSASDPRHTQNAAFKIR